MVDPDSRVFYANKNNHNEDFKKVGAYIPIPYHRI